ncbi:MAG: acetylxylan esterase [Planctomycetes bacterium]|nr:acetylxylan esterase [Planctomycetota bacterium]
MKAKLLFVLVCLLSTQIGMLSAQDAASISADAKPVVFSVQQDHQNMMKQLGITKLRPGRSGNPSDPNAANTDESKANPYPELPELTTMKDGTRVTTPDQWWKRRRPEIVEDFEREVVGRIPDGVPSVKWKVLKTIEQKLGETEVIEKRLAGHVDNSACPAIRVYIMMSVIVPKNAKKPAPTLMQFGFTWFGLDGEEFNFGGGFGRGRGGPSKEQLLVEAGWGCATVNAYSVQEDAGGETKNRFGPPRPPGGGLTRGIIGLTNKGQPRKLDQWGALRAWAWGASRGLDYLETDPAVDAKRVGIDGVSRFGKAALVTMAFDQRFATVLVGSSGEGGASLYRRNFGESVENLTGSGGYHWMAGNFLKYGAAEASFGSMNASDLPVDAHMLIALCAPRPTFISYGVPEKGDALWLDQQGSFMAAIAAQPAFRLLGARDLGRSDDYMKEKMPPVKTDMLDGELAWRQHDGGHTDMPNIPHFLKWMDRLWAEKDAQAGAPR